MSAPLTVDVYRLELSAKSRNGSHFLAAGAVVWLLIAGLWLQPFGPGFKGLLTFCAGTLVLPLAYGLGRLQGAAWSVADNPLQPLALWLNFAQLFYFPMLVWVYMHEPQYFVLCYGIITGAHFFPYAWLYRTPAYAGGAGVVAAGCLVLQLTVGAQPAVLAGFVALSLLLMAVLARVAAARNAALYQAALAARPAVLA